jgi:hypothetical protein
MGEWRYNCTQVNFTPRPLYPLRNAPLPRYPFDKRLNGSQSRSGRGGEDRTSLSLQGSNPGRPAHNLVTILNELPYVWSVVVVGSWRDDLQVVVWRVVKQWSDVTVCKDPRASDFIVAKLWRSLHLLSALPLIRFPYSYLTIFIGSQGRELYG